MIALGSLTACNDFLEEAPILSQSDELTLSTIDGLDAAVAGAYSPLASYAWYGCEVISINEMKTSNGKKNMSNPWDTGRFSDEYNLSWSETTTASLWSYAYYVISAANNVIDALDGVEGDEDTKNNLKAECLFLRALAHFDLVRMYAMPYEYQSGAQDGVPIVLHTDSSAKPARNTVSEVYEQILADLLEAEGLMDSSYERDGDDTKAYANIYAIQALIARASLYCHKYQQAADYATKVISSGEYRLWTVDELTDGAIYAVDVPSDGEVIFEVYGSKSNSYDPYRDSICNMTTPGGYGDGGAALDIVNLYEDSDVRGTIFIHDEDEDVYWTAKYQGKGAGEPDYNNVIVLRLSEMYLIRAEAVIEGATGSTALTDLNTIANQRGETPYTVASIDNVALERQKELAWEGHLWYDLGRYCKDMTREDFVGSASSQNVSNWTSATDYYKWAMPIPASEYRTNENLTHNPGWN